jgi:FKBP-type peptidyl-prolyl cis-trans isomerase FklB
LSPQANAAFLAANAQKPGVLTTSDGLQYKIIHNGFGKSPTPFDKVQVYYTGALINGTVFDATEPNLPATFTVNELITGWTEALERMREGDHWQVVIPANLAYGARGAGNGAIPPDQVLVFDLELVKVLPPPKAPPSDASGQ